jgi:uncharacterized membrane protein YeaQ/YmgE (transglycosylase-associated protein family)
MDIASLLIQLVAGGAGGNVAGMLNKTRSLGPMLNTILGAVGGVGGSAALGSTLGGLIGNPMVANALASLVGGILIPLIGSYLKPAAKA